MPGRPRRRGGDEAVADPAAAELAEPATEEPPRKKKRRRQVEALEEADDEAPPENGKSGAVLADKATDDIADPAASLLRLRSLLAPAGSAEELVPAAAPKPAVREEARPDWTSRYYVVQASDPHVPLDELRWPLDPALRRAMLKAGFTQLFPIQAAVIPLLLRSAELAYDLDSPYSCDVCVAAPTGQGKTLAYAVPIVQALLGRLAARCRALVVLPTRDLALQVFYVFDLLRQGLGPGVTQVRAQCLVGQKSFTEEQQALREHPADIVVCTPGRLADHTLGREANLDLSSLRWFVADEADRLLSQTYHRWLDVLDKAAAAVSDCAPALGPVPQLQRLLLSATMTWNPQKLAMLRLRRPFYFFSSQTGQHSTPVELKQHYVECKPDAKPLALLHLLASMVRDELAGRASGGDASAARALVFCSSVDTAHRLTRLMQIFCLGVAEEDRGHDPDEVPLAGTDRVPDVLQSPGAVAEFTSTLPQQDRTALLKRFRRSEVRCMVCTDVAARGLDVPEVQVVVNYSMPSHLETYIHRAGRTARAGRSGHTFTFVRHAEMKRFEVMLRESADCWERLQEFPLPEEAGDVEQAWYPKALQLLRRCLTQEEKGGVSPGQPLRSLSFGATVDSPAAGQEKVEHLLAERGGAKGRKRPPEPAEPEPAEEPADGPGNPKKKRRQRLQAGGREGAEGRAPAPPRVPVPLPATSLLDFVRRLPMATVQGV